MPDSPDDRQPDGVPVRPGGEPPQPRGDRGARPDTPEPAGKRYPVDAPASPSAGDGPSLPPVPETGPDDGAPPSTGPASAQPAGGPRPAGRRS